MTGGGGRGQLAGIFALIGAEAFIYGYSFPYFSLSLHGMGMSSGVVGLNSSAAGLGIIFVGPFVPRLLARFGMKQVVAAQFALSALCFGTLLVWTSVPAWFAVRLVLGTVMASIWTTTEIWLNAVVSDRHRGRVLGISGAWYACCQFLGPLALGVVGVAGRGALLTAIIPLGTGVLVALSLRPAGAAGTSAEQAGDRRGVFRAAWALLLAAFVTGIGEASMQGLLPLYGLSHGLSEAGSARLVAVFSGGEAVLVVVLGWLADRVSQDKILAGSMLTGAVLAALLPLAGTNLVWLYILLFLAGGTLPGVYTIGIVLIGRNFGGDRLPSITVAFAIAYSAGSALGPTPVGFLFRAMGPSALPETVAVTFAATALAIMAGRIVARLRPERNDCNP
jgi:MFS family permease